MPVEGLETSTFMRKPLIQCDKITIAAFRVPLEMSEYVKRRLEELGIEPRFWGKRISRTAARYEWEEQYRKKYRKDNAAMFAAHTAARHARKMQQRPSWADVKAIRALYKEAREISLKTGIKHHVDHIVPLVSDVVSGLHVLANLRVIPAEENVRKSNKLG